MILVSLIYNREILNFAIQDKIIKYTDRKWGKWIQCIPKDKEFIKQVVFSRGKFPHFLIKMFDLSVKEQVEYEAAKTDEELAQIIIRDGKLKGCKSATKKYVKTVPQMKTIQVSPAELLKKEINRLKELPMKKTGLDLKAIRPVRGNKNDS